MYDMPGCGWHESCASVSVSGERDVTGLGDLGRAGWDGCTASSWGVWLLEAGAWFNSVSLDFQSLIKQ